MKTIIAGGRDFDDYKHLKKCLARLPWKITTVVCGGARGADNLGRRWAKENGLPVSQFNANWSLHGRAAGPIRNVQMARYAEALVAFWDGESRGTKHMIETADKFSLRVHVFRY